MEKQILSEGTLVKNRENGREGIAVFDVFKVCGQGEVLIQWDGSFNTYGTKLEEIEVLTILDLKVDSAGCKNCVFFLGNGRCPAYSAGRTVFILMNSGIKRQPKRIYPYCREEFPRRVV